MMKRIVISGAGGFLGKHLIAEATEQSIPVMAITRDPAEFADDAIEAVSTADFLSGKICFSEDDVFINCVFPTNADGIKMANGLKTVYEIIRMAKKCGIKTFINISSQSVYPSKRKNAASESDQLSLETPYAVGKYSTEAFTDEVFAGIPHTNIRLASLIGVGYEQRIVNRMVSQALKGEKLKVIGGMQQYGFLDVRDAADGLIKMALSDANAWKPVYNLGRMESVTLLDVAETVVSQLQKQGCSAEFIVTEGLDERNSSIDVSAFCEDFKWNPKISFEQTVTDIIENKK